MGSRRRPLFVVLLMLAVGGYFLLSPRLPKDQSVNVVLGDGADRVTDVTLRYTAHGESETAREATFHFDRAPRVVHHEPRLPDGDYDLAIDLRGPTNGAHVDRKLALSAGATTSVDLSETRLAARSTSGDTP
jgi:hypothetical protein